METYTHLPAPSASPMFKTVWGGMLSNRQPLYPIGKHGIDAFLESERREGFDAVRGVKGARRVAVWLLLQCNKKIVPHHDSVALSDAFFHLFASSEEKSCKLASTIRATIACSSDARRVMVDKGVSNTRIKDAALLVTWNVENKTSAYAKPYLRHTLFQIDEQTTTIMDEKGGATWDATDGSLKSELPPCCTNLSGRHAAELFQSMLIASRENGAPFETEINAPLPPMSNDTLRKTFQHSNKAFIDLLTHKEMVRGYTRRGTVYEALDNTEQMFRITPRSSIEALVNPRPQIDSDIETEYSQATCATTTMDAWPAFLLCDSKHKRLAQMYCKSSYPGLAPPVGPKEQDLGLHLAWGRVRPLNVARFTSNYAPIETTTHGSATPAHIDMVIGRLELTLLPLANEQLFKFCYMQPMKSTFCFEHNEDPGAFARQLRQLNDFVREVTITPVKHTTSLDDLQRDFDISPYGTDRLDNYPCTMSFDARLRIMQSDPSTLRTDLGLSQLVAPMFRTPFPSLTVGGACTAALHSAKLKKIPLEDDGTYTFMLELLRMEGASASLGQAMLNLSKYAAAMRENGIQPHTAKQRLRALKRAHSQT